MHEEVINFSQNKKSNLFSDITPPDDYVPDKIALPMR